MMIIYSPKQVLNKIKYKNLHESKVPIMTLLTLHRPVFLRESQTPPPQPTATSGLLADTKLAT